MKDVLTIKNSALTEIAFDALFRVSDKEKSGYAGDWITLSRKIDDCFKSGVENDSAFNALFRLQQAIIHVVNIIKKNDRAVEHDEWNDIVRSATEILNAVISGIII